MTMGRSIIVPGIHYVQNRVYVQFFSMHTVQNSLNVAIHKYTAIYKEFVKLTFSVFNFVQISDNAQINKVFSAWRA